MSELDTEVGDHLNTYKRLKSLEEKMNQDKKVQEIIADPMPEHYNEYYDYKKYDLVPSAPKLEASAPLLDLPEVPNTPIKMLSITNQANEYEGEYSSHTNTEEEQFEYPISTSY